MKISSRLNWKGSSIDPTLIGLNVQRERRFIKEFPLPTRGGDKIILFFFNDIVISGSVQKSRMSSSPADPERLKCKVKSAVWYDRCVLRDLPDLPKEKNMFEIVSTDDKNKDSIRLYLSSPDEKKEVSE